VCAHAVRVAVLKLEGVEGIDVSLKTGSAVVRLRPGNRVTLPQLRQIIKDNGFTSKDATVTALGTLVERGGKPALDISGLATVALLIRDPKQPDAFDAAAKLLAARDAAPVEVVGVIPASPDPSKPQALMIQSIKPAGR
jgi:hypothetical protein